MNSVYIVWQDEVTRLWHPVAKLTHLDNGYRLNYTRGSRSSIRFKPFTRMDDLSKVYESKELFPVFKNRIMPSSRPEFRNIINWLGMQEDSFDPLLYLAASGGARSTDSYMVVPVPEGIDGKYTIQFLVSGIRYLEDKIIDRIDQIKTPMAIDYDFEINNPVDKNAIALYLNNKTHIGYCPRYLAGDFKKLIQSDQIDSAEFVIDKINADAPSRYKALCSFTTTWPKDFVPFISDEYIAI